MQDPPLDRRSVPAIERVRRESISSSGTASATNRFVLPPDKPLTLAAYSAGTTITAYIEPVAVGDVLPDLPIFLTPERYVPCPLESTYQASWDVFPKAAKALYWSRPRNILRFLALDPTGISMTAADVATLLQSEFASSVTGVAQDGPDLSVTAEPARLVEIAPSCATIHASSSRS